MKRNSKRQGEAGEIEFLHRACQLGLRVSKPYGDSDPYDFIVDNGSQLFRLQVKTTGSIWGGAYRFAVGYGRKCRPLTKRVVDLIAVWIPPLDVWYLIPVQAFRGRRAAGVFPSTRNSCGRYERYREAWHLLGTSPAGTR